MAGEFTADIEKIRERARAEMRRGAVTDSYGPGDATTRRLMESVIEMEEEHADDMLDLLQYFS